MKNKILLVLLTTTLLLSIIATASEEIEVIITKNKHFDKNTKQKVFTTKSVEQEIKIKHQYQSFEGYSAKITKKEYEKIKNNPEYEIQEAKKFYTTLDYSAPQIQADQTWKLRLNNNITGTGQTVCVIDTGVNYSHEAFGNCWGNNNASSNCTIIGGYNFVNESEPPMDDNWHGTHVAGIIASQDNTYKGIAPGAKIIAIKAMDSTGSGYDSDIIAGIEWCTNNATTFNITTISMSLGDCTNWTNSCDGNSNYSNTWVPAINAATAKNISVIVSAGNGPNAMCNSTIAPGMTYYNGPSGPACVENATAIGGVDDSDNIHTLNWQRGGNILEIMAPGNGIISIDYTGGFTPGAGTSMAAPHVAGVVALLQQIIKEQYGKEQTKDYIINHINNTGPRINDTGVTNKNYTRVDAYQAALTLDKTTPTVTLNNPTDNTVNSSINQTFICQGTDWQLANATLTLWNNTEVYYTNTTNSTGTTNSSTYTVSNIPTGTYTWNCEYEDEQNNKAYATNNNTLIIGTLLITLNNTLNNYETKNNITGFSCNATTSQTQELTNNTLLIWKNNTLYYNETKTISGTTNSSSYSYNITEDGNYKWNCEATNNESTTAQATNNNTITKDSQGPIITNITTTETTSTQTTITWKTDEEANSSITGEITGNAQTPTTSHSITITGLGGGTTYNYYITSCDNKENCNTSTEQSITTTTASSGGGSSGGSGGGISSTSTTTKENINTTTLQEGTTTTITTTQKKKFVIGTNNHSITLNNITNNTIAITIQSETITDTLTIGEEKKYNLTNKEYFDLYIKLNNINNKEANITLQQIKEKIPLHTKEKTTTGTIKSNNETKEDNKGKITGTIILIILLLYLTNKKIQENRKKEKEQMIRKKYRT